MSRTPRIAVIAACSLLVAAAALACSSGGNGGGGPTPTIATTPGGPTPTGPVPTFPVRTDPTPSTLEEARAMLSNQLEAIGANIGSVPDDIAAQLIGRCETLAEFADPDEVSSICRAIQQAIDTNDPGLIDSVLRRLAGLVEG